MQIARHAERSEALTGLRAEDIHQWIDGFFDADSFDDFKRSGERVDFDPYNHRKYRHCTEALEDAYRIFGDRYSREQIKAVFESHIRDDYQGYIPRQEDFENGTFTEKYHELGGGTDLASILSEAELAEYFNNKAYSRNRATGVSPRFYWRIVWPTVFAAILFAVSSLSIIVPLFRRNMLAQKKEQIRELTRTAASAIAYYIHQEQDGQMTRAAAQAEAAAELAQLRYGEDGKDYFWITDMHPVMVMHPYRPDLTGRDLTDYTDHEDKSGKRLFVEFVKLVEAGGEGYLAYDWQWKDDPSRIAPKLSYVRGIPEWNWIIGTGIYIHDVEAEMDRLSRNLLTADVLIFVVLFVILANLLLQSRKIEQERRRAEDGLREAKDRYRALVDASGEGSLLEIDGKTIYSNPTMQKMTGYSEAELVAMDAASLLAPGFDVNAFAADHLRKLYAGDASAAVFDAVLKTRTGAVLDVQGCSSRLFLSQKNGHVIVFRSLNRSHERTLRDFQQADASSTDVELLEDGLPPRIQDCQSAGEVLHVLEELPRRLRLLTDRCVRPDYLRQLIGNAFDAAVQRFVALSLENAGTPPVPFAFLTLGSNARHEMTLFSDQDNALIFEAVAESRLTDNRRWFLRLGDEVCGRLRQAGFSYCPGGIMAANPKWCLSLSEWKARFDDWIGQASPQSILEVNVFLDVRCVSGDASLVQQLREHVHVKTQAHPGFLLHYARNCLLYKAPLTLFGHLKGNRQDDRRTINIKESIKPFETFARLYALKHHLPEIGTLDRIRQLCRLDALPDQTAREMCYAFDYLWHLRFYHQLSTDDGSFTDALDIESMTDIERQNLQNVVAAIPAFQSRLSYDFLGVAGG
jgi:PAS domain S-box-containing protein